MMIEEEIINSSTYFLLASLLLHLQLGNLLLLLALRLLQLEVLHLLLFALLLILFAFLNVF